MDPLHLLLRLALAALLGSVIGLERERLDWAAGLRDHMLVCLGAALFMIVSCYGFEQVVHAPQVVLDPSRVAAQVVSGIGFLGAGTILVRGEVIKGLTTAASLWAIAAVGLAAGGGLYLAASAATMLYLVILAGIKPLEKRLFNDRRFHAISLSCTSEQVRLADIEEGVRRYGCEIIEIRLGRSAPGQARTIDLTVRRCPLTQRLQLIDALQQVPGVHAVSHHAWQP